MLRDFWKVKMYESIRIYHIYISMFDDIILFLCFCFAAIFFFFVVSSIECGNVEENLLNFWIQILYLSLYQKFGCFRLKNTTATQWETILYLDCTLLFQMVHDYTKDEPYVTLWDIDFWKTSVYLKIGQLRKKIINYVVRNTKRNKFTFEL